MSIDINELRPAVEFAGLNAISMQEVLELLDRLEAAEKSDAESIAMYRKARDERDALRAAVRHEADCVEACKSEIDALRAKITEMERQEPVGTVHAMPGAGAFTMACFDAQDIPAGAKLYALPGAQQCKNCNGMGDRFDPSGEKIPCDLCESNLEDVRVLVAEAAHDIISGSDFWLSTSLAAKKICALPDAKGEEK